MLEKMSVLIIDADEKAVRDVKTALQYKGYTVFVAPTVIQAKRIIMKESPHLILLNTVLPDAQGFRFLRELKSNVMFANIPIVIVSENKTMKDRIEGLEIGADDYIGKPFELAELLARVGSIIKRNYYSLDANPLTRLPGNLSIIRTIEERLQQNQPIAITYFDLDHFKAFNDAYGFTMGDKIIQHTAKIILGSIHDCGTEDDFVGHIGGDDFIVVSTPERIDNICLNVIKKFDATIKDFYHPDDREKGKIIIQERRGKVKEFPIMSISAATMTNQYKNIQHIGEISAITSELKRYAKSFKGSCYVRDRRDQRGISTALVYSGMGQTADMKLTEDEEMQYKEELQKIISERNITVLFQPIINLKNDDIIGHEAFCRGPQGSELENPFVLFRVARRTGFVLELDQICREKVLSIARQQKEDMLLFINIWPESLEDPNFQSERFLNYVMKDPGSIIFEIGGLETPLSFEIHQKALRYFQKKGFRIAVDNVGGGQVMGLGIIAEIRPAYVKLDISLMRGIHEDVLKQQTLRALVSIFTQLHIKVIAEKVELSEELEFLKTAGVPYAQGYLFARPERVT